MCKRKGQRDSDGRVQELHTPVSAGGNEGKGARSPWKTAWDMLKWALAFALFVLLGYVFLYFAQGIN